MEQNADKAGVACDALAKSVYERLFSHLVQTINACIGVKSEKHTALGVLDIYGFEIFPTNGWVGLAAAVAFATAAAVETKGTHTHTYTRTHMGRAPLSLSLSASVFSRCWLLALLQV